jgi:hypothetical protein
MTAGGLGGFGFEVEPFGSAVRLDPNNCFARMKLAVVHSRCGQLQQVRKNPEPETCSAR